MILAGLPCVFRIHELSSALMQSLCTRLTTDAGTSPTDPGTTMHNSAVRRGRCGSVVRVGLAALCTVVSTELGSALRDCGRARYTGCGACAHCARGTTVI